MLMNLEELNKSQVVLLTLLISFVTSMATGIVAVSLMEQGVSPVTNTVNKIVERTKEIIVKVEDPRDPVIITEEKTVVIHEEDLVASAIAKNKDSSVSIYKSVIAEIDTDNTAEIDTEQATTTDSEVQTQTASVVVALEEGETATSTTPVTETQLVFVARGVVLGGGVVATDASMLDADVSEYTIITNTGKHMPATVSSSDSGVALLDSEVRGGAQLVDTSSLDHGQVVIVLSGTNRMRVVKTIIAEIGTSAIDTNAGNISPGSMLISLEGKLVGLSTGASRINGKSWFTTANKIEAALHSADSTDI